MLGRVAAMSELEIQILHRDRLCGYLAQSERYPLTVISAPIGYGKTMATLDFFKLSGRRYFWITLTAPVKIPDSSYFWLLFTSSLRDSAPELRNELEAMGFPEDAMQTLRFLETLRTYPFEQDVYVIFDNFQYINTFKVTDLISQVVQAAIPRLHIVLIGRNIPALPVIEWEMKGICMVLNAKTLAFTPEESRKYLELIHFNEDSSVQEQIVASSNGWISSLYLMANDYVHFHNIDHHSNIYAMLRSSLYDTYSKTEQEYLMKLSLLNSFSSKHIAMIFRDSDAIDFVERLYTSNALIIRDANGNYRFHDLFKDFLQNELERSGLDIRPFAARVARVAAENHLYLSAFKFWMLAENHDAIFEELEEAPVVELLKMDRKVLKKLFSAPEDKLYQYPMALLKYIFLICMEDNVDLGKKMLKDFYERCETLNHPEFSGDHLKAECLVLGTSLVFNDLDKIIDFMEEAARLLHGEKSSIRIRTSNLTYGSPHMTYAYYNKPGNYQHITEDFIKRFDAHIEVADGNGFGADCVAQAEYNLETGHLDDVEYWAKKALFKASHYDQTCMRICAYMTLGRLYIVKKQREQALDVIRQLKGMFNEIHDSSKLCALDCAIGYLYANLGDYDNIPKWLCAGDFDSESSIQQRLAFNYIVFGKAVILNEDYVHLDFLTEMFQRSFDSFSYQLGFIHNYIFSAVCDLHLHDADTAVKTLQKAVDIAVKDDIVMPFVEYYSILQPVLENRRLRIPDEARERIRELACAGIGKTDEVSESPITELLTSRELEIMDCLARGMSNAEISEALFITGNTTKRHIQNIYRKLDVPNKTMAIIRYREMS